MTAPCGAPAMARSNFHGLGFTLFLAALTALPPLSIDMALPSLALIQADLHAPQTKAAAAIAIFIAGFSTAPIVVGPLADRFGRKAVMLVGLAVFTLTAAGSALAPSIDALLALRLVQGASAGAVGILPRAIIRDLFEGREARLQLSAVSIVFSVGPLIAASLALGLACAPAIPVAALEDLGAFRSFRRSAALTKDGYGRIALLYLSYFGLLVAWAVAFYALISALDRTSAQGALSRMLVRLCSLVSFWTLLLVPQLYMVALTRNYFDQRARSRELPPDSQPVG